MVENVVDNPRFSGDAVGAFSSKFESEWLNATFRGGVLWTPKLSEQALA